MTALDLRALGADGRRSLSAIVTECREQAPVFFDRLAAALDSAGDIIEIELDLDLADTPRALAVCMTHAIVCTHYAETQTEPEARIGLARLARLFLQIHAEILRRTDPDALRAIRALNNQASTLPAA